MKTLLITNNSGSGNFICRKLHESWNFIVKNDSRKKTKEYNFLEQNDDFRIIESRFDFEKFDFKKFRPDVIFVVPELMWEQDGVNEGYSIAKEIIAHKMPDAFFQLAFLSILRRADILSKEYVSPKHFNLVKAFPHYYLLEDTLRIDFSPYSRSHFQLIKLLALTDSGWIDIIEHAISGIKEDVRGKSEGIDLDDEKRRLKRQLSELALLQLWSAEKLEAQQKALDDDGSKSRLLEAVSLIESALQDIKGAKKDHEVKEDPHAKINYQVLIIEDNENYRELFVRIFSALYRRVYPDTANAPKFDIRDAVNVLREHAKESQIIILDLLYEDENECWLNFNGLDLYQMIKKDLNPYAAVRIITNLPREIVARVIQLTTNISVPISHVFTKKGGRDALEINIIQRSDEINQECRENERKRAVFKPFPQHGIFKSHGIPALMSSLLGQERAKYEECLQKARGFYHEFFKTGQIQSMDWERGQIPSEKMVGKIKESYFLQKLPIILTHRLFVLHHAYSGTVPRRVDCGSYQENILSAITDITSIRKTYFTTKLGLRINKTESEDFFDIKETEFFPEEIVFISEVITGREKGFDKTLDSYPKLKKWFTEIVLPDPLVYESWEELELDAGQFYKSEINIIYKKGECELSDICEKLSLDDLSKFLQSLHTHCQKPFVAMIIDEVITNNPLSADGEKELEPLKNIFFLYSQIFRLPV